MGGRRFEDSGSGCKPQPIFLKCGKRGLGCPPTSNDHHMAAFRDSLLLRPDDLPQSAADLVSHHRHSDSFGSDEAELKSTADSSPENCENEITTGKASTLASDAGIVPRLLDAKVRREAHEKARRLTGPKPGCGA